MKLLGSSTFSRGVSVSYLKADSGGTEVGSVFSKASAFDGRFPNATAVAVAASALNFYSQTVFTNTTRRLARLVMVCLQLEVITDHAFTCRF